MSSSKGLLHIGGLAHIHKTLHVDCEIFIQYTVEIALKSIGYFRVNLATKLCCVINAARCILSADFESSKILLTLELNVSCSVLGVSDHA